MAKALHPTTEKVLKCIQARFKFGQVLSYERIGGLVGISRETARVQAKKLQAKRLVTIKGGHITGVK